LTDSTKDFTISVQAICDKTTGFETTTFPESIAASSDPCNLSSSFKSALACSKGIPIQQAMNAVSPFFNPILIVFGLIMLIFGSKFLFVLTGTTVGLAATTVAFGIAYSLFMSVETATGALIGAAVGCLILGIIVAVLTYKLTVKFAVQVLASLSGAAGFMYLSNFFVKK
jgi:hypothetical protein